MQISKLSIGMRRYQNRVLLVVCRCAKPLLTPVPVVDGVATQIDNQLALLGFDASGVPADLWTDDESVSVCIYPGQAHVCWSGLCSNTGTLESGAFSSPALGRIEQTYWNFLPPSYAVSPARHYATFYLLYRRALAAR